jgi:hypothetical protein
MGHYISYLPSAAQQMLPSKINTNTWKILKYTSNHNPQTARHREENQLDATQEVIDLVICSTCFRH